MQLFLFQALFIGSSFLCLSSTAPEFDYPSHDCSRDMTALDCLAPFSLLERAICDDQLRMNFRSRSLDSAHFHSIRSAECLGHLWICRVPLDDSLSKSAV